MSSSGNSVAASTLFLIAVLSACGSDEPAARGGGCVERAVEAGIGFRMKFLFDEQGANFKINFYDHASGVAVADYDGDGDDDIYFVNQLGPNALYRNKGDGTFEDVTAQAGPIALGDRICVSAAFNDVDNDGDQDLYVTSTRGGNAFFRNDGSGHFVDATDEAGLKWIGHTQGVTFFDADGDGDLDLFLANTAMWTTDSWHPRDHYYRGVANLMEVIESPVELNAFFRNDGSGKFTDATEAAGLRGLGWGGDTAVFDYDEDGDLDLFVANMFGGSLLYRNDGKGHFEIVTDGALGKTPWGAVGCKAFDYDNDGHLDLYVVDMHSDMWTPADYDLSTVDRQRKYRGCFGPLMDGPDFQAWQEAAFMQKTKTRPGTVFFGNGLYRNKGDGTFEEVSGKAGMETFWPWGIAAGDFDNDGFVDVFLASGMGYPWEFWRNPYLHNNGDGTFSERSAEAGVDPPPGGPFLGPVLRGKKATRSSRSAAVADFDGDGRLDLVVNNFNDRPYLYMNRRPRRNYIAFRLRGTRQNRDAVGAVVRLHVGDKVLVRQVHAAGGYLAQSSKTLHFGLGDAQSVERCEIRWPGGRVQVLETPKPNRLHEVTEPTE